MRIPTPNYPVSIKNKCKTFTATYNTGKQDVCDFLDNIKNTSKYKLEAGLTAVVSDIRITQTVDEFTVFWVEKIFSYDEGK